MLYVQVAVLLSAVVLASINIRRAGWLDRVVEYQKNKFFEELKQLPPVNLKARIEKAPPGYVDSGNWDYESVIRLLTLIRDSEGAKSVKQAIRRSMQSGRRFMSFQNSFKAFPSLAKDHINNFYYDVDSGEYYADTVIKPSESSILEEDDIIVVSNPVEARLPSARISVKLLKEILESRAKAARATTSTKKTISWSTKNKLTTKTKGVKSEQSTSSSPEKTTTITTTEPSTPTGTPPGTPPGTPIPNNSSG